MHILIMQTNSTHTSQSRGALLPHSLADPYELPCQPPRWLSYLPEIAIARFARFYCSPANNKNWKLLAADLKSNKCM